MHDFICGSFLYVLHTVSAGSGRQAYSGSPLEGTSQGDPGGGAQPFGFSCGRTSATAGGGNLGELNRNRDITISQRASSSRRLHPLAGLGMQSLSPASHYLGSEQTKRWLKPGLRRTPVMGYVICSVILMSSVWSLIPLSSHGQDRTVHWAAQLGIGQGSSAAPDATQGTHYASHSAAGRCDVDLGMRGLPATIQGGEGGQWEAYMFDSCMRHSCQFCSFLTPVDAMFSIAGAQTCQGIASVTTSHTMPRTAIDPYGRPPIPRRRISAALGDDREPLQGRNRNFRAPWLAKRAKSSVPGE